ncbi:MAG: UDP-N-acetylmuramoyl-tripeptide--D-alanyl-D-alanine ligase [Bacteroidia bacterium]|nr:UDP-N-acetylmuramoyl-tripeptide--D-alanyl-D-alanine ligase [Bacteroidia bacterium]
MTYESLIEQLFSGAGASVDTRTLQPGQVFFALPGERTHGAVYAAEALDKGASAVVLPDGYPMTFSSERVFFHPDPLRLLGEIAAAYRAQFSLPVIAIGGSNGKTTTKALLGHLLNAQAPTLVSPRSWNNAIGVPLTLLRLSSHHRFAVIELGDNRPGEVKALCQIAQPTLGLITNVGWDHLEGYGSLSANLSAKWELVDYLASQTEAVFFLNTEDQLLSAQPFPSSLRVYRYGNTSDSFATATWMPIDWGRSRLRGRLGEETFDLEVPLWGSYNRLNILAAISMGKVLGLSLSEMAKALQSFQNEPYRSQIIHRGGKTLILEAYNANPSSLSASLQALWESLKNGDRVALVLGQMEELGTYTEEAHRRALAELRPHAARIAGVLLVGPYWEIVKGESWAFPMEWVSHADFISGAPKWMHEAPVLYFKGSRRQKLEQLVERLFSE